MMGLAVQAELGPFRVAVEQWGEERAGGGQRETKGPTDPVCFLQCQVDQCRQGGGWERVCLGLLCSSTHTPATWVKSLLGKQGS